MRKLAFFVVVALVCAAGPVAGQTAAEKSLYVRLGGYDAIAAVVDDLLGRLPGDPLLAPFFRGKSSDSLKKDRQLIVEFLCQAAGGPCLYMGRTMKVSHAGLAISEEHWQELVKLLTASLDKFKVAQREQRDLLILITALKPDVVTAK